MLISFSERIEMEYRDLYDKNRILTGEKFTKGDIIPAGRYFVTVMVFIENSNGQLLLQQRSENRSGKWATTGGHPKTGESSLDGMLSEIKEEIGISVAKEELTLYKTIQTNNDFVDFYYLKKDINLKDIKMQEEEVQNVNWFTIQKIEELIKNNQFFPPHLNPYREFLKYRNLK